MQVACLPRDGALALAAGNTEETGGEPRQRGIEDSGKPERPNLPRHGASYDRRARHVIGFRFVPALTTARHTAFPLEAPVRHSPEYRVRSQAAN
jgi:hypothetical protein